MLKHLKIGVVTLAISVLAVSGAQAACLKKAAVATSGSESSAKWFALETMVQAVSWGLWPSFVANGSTPGYKITRQRYSCKKNGLSVTCRGWATFCTTKK